MGCKRSINFGQEKLAKNRSWPVSELPGAEICTWFTSAIRSGAELGPDGLLISASDPKQNLFQFQILSGNLKGHCQNVPQYCGKQGRNQYGMQYSVFGQAQNSESHEANERRSIIDSEQIVAKNDGAK